MWIPCIHRVAASASELWYNMLVSETEPSVARVRTDPQSPSPSAPAAGPDLPPGVSYAPTDAPPATANPASTPPARPLTNPSPVDHRLVTGRSVASLAMETERWPPFGMQKSGPNVPAPRGPAGPPPFIFEFNPYELFPHPLWAEVPNVIPGVRVDIRYRTGEAGEWTWDPAAGPLDSSRAFSQLLVRTMRLLGPIIGDKLGSFRWAAIPAAFGRIETPELMAKMPNLTPLLRNPKDHLKSGRLGPFMREGMLACRTWSEEMFGHLAAELHFRGLPDPSCILLSSENGPGDDYAGHTGDSPEQDKGWVPEAMADDRADDPLHVIDGRRTFRQFIEQARTLSGDPIPAHLQRDMFGNPPARDPRNDESSERFRGALRLAWDWSREVAIGRPARLAFRRDPARPDATVRICEYQAACDAKWSPWRFRPGSLAHQMDGIFHTDWQSPDWYGDLPWLRPSEPFNSKSNSWETYENWLRVFPNSIQDHALARRRLALDVHIDQLKNHARAAPHAPLAPYITDIPFEDDLVEYIGAARQFGAAAIIVFMPKCTPAICDYWLRIVRRVHG